MVVDNVTSDQHHGCWQPNVRSTTGTDRIDPALPEYSSLAQYFNDYYKYSIL